MRAGCGNESKDMDRQDVPLCPPEVFADTGNGWSLDDFDELREIGKGKDTVIYGGCCRKLQGTEVAVKKYDKAKVSSTKLRAIKREVAIMLFLARKRVPNVVNMYGAFADSQGYYIVMEYCAGGDLLESLLKRKRAMHENAAMVQIVLPILDTLCHLHSFNIIHRDVKLENIFLDEAGKVKLGDFGLTMCTAQEAAISPVGTVEYMAPEVVCLPSVDLILSGKINARDISPTTDKVDIWALGVTLFELVSGKLPFEGPDKAGIKESILQNRMSVLPSNISEDCKSLIWDMLSYFPEDRPSAFTVRLKVSRVMKERNTKSVVKIEARTNTNATGLMGSGGVKSAASSKNSGSFIYSNLAAVDETTTAAAATPPSSPQSQAMMLTPFVLQGQQMPTIESPEVARKPSNKIFQAIRRFSRGRSDSKNSRGVVPLTMSEDVTTLAPSMKPASIMQRFLGKKM